MITELTFTVLKYAFLLLLWVFVWLISRSLYRDVATFSPRKSRASRRKERQARKKAEVPAPRRAAAAFAPIHRRRRRRASSRRRSRRPPSRSRPCS
ncbi:hypothetical protein PGB23_08200 [Bifidobacterium pseudolongum subsp. pseudolongum]|nr:hypothetical protein [Bifidobacterium pseudolongum]WCA40879.1 hypothetical protein PGB23_08200 [Bifidobacterium pseudolongum subsp. pseudolongum]